MLIVDWQAHRNAIFDIDWMPGENQLVTAGGDQDITLWDVAAERTIATFHGHTSSIKAVRFCPSHSGRYCCRLITVVHQLKICLCCFLGPFFD